jgi:hypothetical protein
MDSTGREPMLRPHGVIRSAGRLCKMAVQNAIGLVELVLGLSANDNRITFVREFCGYWPCAVVHGRVEIATGVLLTY